MLSKTLYALGVSVAALAFTAPALAQDTVAPHSSNPNGPVSAWDVEATDVEPDAEIVYGTLSNGMKYAIRKNETPKGAASFRMHFDFGSLYESEEERGLAHFIEHMVFNGSTNVPEGEMIPILERLGLAFGADTNAYTNFDETVYKLDAPTANDEAIDTSLFLLREVAGEASFTPSAVDSEREIITSERRARDSVQLRTIIDRLAFQIPDTLYDDRLPIGLETVLRGAPASRLKALYHRYYRPENATLVVVGDFDVADMERRIAERFGDWQGVGPAGAKPDIGSVDLERPMAFDVFTDPASVSGATISIARPYSDPADTIAERRTETLEQLGTAIMNRRLQRIAGQENSQLLGGSMFVEPLPPVAKMTSLSVGTGEGLWKEGLTIAENELRRALQYGFTQNELNEAMANAETGRRNAAEQAGGRSSAGLADAIVAVAGENDFVTSPVWRYALWQGIKDTITLDAVNAAFRTLWTGSQPLISVTAKEFEGGEDAVAAAWTESAAVAVEAPTEGAAASFAYDTFGDGPGQVVSDTTIDDLGIRTVTFDNNVRLNIKQTDFEPGAVRFQIGMDGGLFALGDASPANALLLQIASPRAGTQGNSFDELQQVLAGRNITVGFAPGTDEFIAAGATTPADLALQMKVSAAYLTDFGFRPEAQSYWNSLIGAVYGQLTSQPQLVYTLQRSTTLTDDPRQAFPSQEELAAANFASFRDAYLANAADAPIEIAVVGDIDPNAAIAAVAQSFGALPDRKATATDYSAQREIVFKDVSGDDVATFMHSGPADQAVVGSVWRTSDDSDFHDVVAMNLLLGVIDLYATETLREKFAATYSPSVESAMSSDFMDDGSFSLSAVVDPKMADEVLALIPNLVARLRDTPVDDDTLLRARQPILERLRQSRRNNAFWIGVASTAQSEAERLERVREEEAVLTSLTPDDLMKLARKYLTPERRADIRVLSSQAAPE
ncbi:M16 family metallopeptidase [Pseudoblastomonas halimionae]|uniref:Insulinase family protein n=1 Tax=Alteriqipengyuania halimionae TaxID=1926630 RepID=A0A6I4U1L2_9SPHN|nr:insulinase family protein [Alteriqipengyuania halimionae]MXP09900.1 insulinase family protein [Alteriqipengyuania halimionae]